MSTERGAVRAVALLGGAGHLPERILHQRTQRIPGDDPRGLARAVETVLDDLEAEIGADYEIAGAAVTYRDSGERRAVVTGLASTSWRTASLVSAKSAHLALARAMSWVDGFEHLVICEVVPGYQGFSLISPDRVRVVAGLTTAGTVTPETMRPAVTAAWDQFEAAGVSPDAVVLIGSAAGDPAVTAALGKGFGASVVPCKVAVAGSALGAALVAQPEEASVVATGGRSRRSHATTAVFAAASVLAGGLVVGGVYQASGKSRTESAPTLTDARIAAQTHRAFPAAVAAPGRQSAEQHGTEPGASDQAAPAEEASTDVVTLDPSAVSWGPQWSGIRGFDSDAEDSGHPQQLVKQTDAEVAPAAPSSVVPAPTVPVGSPDSSLLFPGEPVPPAVGTAEFGQWWENHWRMMVQWAALMVPRV
ncbi:hypothetical protein BJY24_004098 [Nocardia transvalensis]|uniref:DUF7159 domain-containing protein n=1 Tax=Nocardia transvalensis TaxID=37333 RepID=A0A7W9PFV0_9NOCA|nr:hypothetical protein [Nocardia transvalensis]MBB5915231.1 hypothetical protein [Nocardia transvalensis]